MKNKIIGIEIFKSAIYKDNRGFFKEVYKKNIIKNNELIFHCASSSKKNVLRGLHTQIKNGLISIGCQHILSFPKILFPGLRRELKAS